MDLLYPQLIRPAVSHASMHPQKFSTRWSLPRKGSPFTGWVNTRSRQTIAAFTCYRPTFVLLRRQTWDGQRHSHLGFTNTKYSPLSLQVTLERLHPVSAGDNRLCVHGFHFLEASEGETSRIHVEPSRIDYPQIPHSVKRSVASKNRA